MRLPTGDWHEVVKQSTVIEGQSLSRLESYE